MNTATIQLSFTHNLKLITLVSNDVIKIYSLSVLSQMLILTMDENNLRGRGGIVQAMDKEISAKVPI